MLKTSLCLLVLTAALAALATTASARPADTFTTRANAACGDYYRAVRALPRPTDMPTLATFMRRAHPLAVRFAQRLRALEPPAAQAAVYRTLVTSVAASNALDPQIATAAKRGDAKRVRTLVAREDELDKTIGVAAMTLRLGVCASPPSA
jgi:hypothetical protein